MFEDADVPGQLKLGRWAAIENSGARGCRRRLGAAAQSAWQRCCEGRLARGGMMAAAALAGDARPLLSSSPAGDLPMTIAYMTRTNVRCCCCVLCSARSRINLRRVSPRALPDHSPARRAPPCLQTTGLNPACEAGQTTPEGEYELAPFTSIYTLHSCDA